MAGVLCVMQDDAPDVPFSSSLVQRLQRFGSYNRFKQVGVHMLPDFQYS